jgi:Reverse transcriptase (RNA-dependent DNA polymerase)
VVEFVGVVDEPTTYRMAVNGPDRVHWKRAAEEEINTLVANGTWEVVDRPPDVKPLRPGWVFKVKMNPDGSIEHNKGRLVAKGCAQRPGLDYTEVSAPTFRPAALRLILALSAAEDLHLRSIDISSAFTYGELEEDIYKFQPEGFHEGGPNKVLKLRKSLYGLKQAARQWNKKLHGVLKGMGFKRLESDRSLYLYLRNDVQITVPVYIDDITLASKPTSAVDKVVGELGQHFKLRDLGETKFLLGVEITRNRSKRSISLSQRQYVVWRTVTLSRLL